MGRPSMLGELVRGKKFSFERTYCIAQNHHENLKETVSPEYVNKLEH
jgi:hypothetical protein